MTLVAALIVVPTRLFPVLLGAVVVFRMLNGQIVARGLVVDPETGRLSALRVQMLVATCIAAGSYIAALAHTPRALPPVDARLLAMVGGANGLLLGTRFFGRLLKNPETNNQS